MTTLICAIRPRFVAGATAPERGRGGGSNRCSKAGEAKRDENVEAERWRAAYCCLSAASRGPRAPGRVGGGAPPRRSSRPMPRDEHVRDWIRAAERSAPEEQWMLLCFLAGQRSARRAELHAAIRRAELLLAAGGDPRRPLELYGRAVTALADDLDDPASRAQLAAGLDALWAETEGPARRGRGPAAAPPRRGPRLAVLRDGAPRRALAGEE